MWANRISGRGEGCEKPFLLALGGGRRWFDSAPLFLFFHFFHFFLFLLSLSLLLRGVSVVVGSGLSGEWMAMGGAVSGRGSAGVPWKVGKEGIILT
jgi:hypothetical protein